MLKKLPYIKVLAPYKTSLRRYRERYAYCGNSNSDPGNPKQISSAEIHMVKPAQIELIKQMAAGVAHEVRNPLTIISGYLQMLQNKIEAAHLNNYFTAIQEAIQETEDLIVDFLNIAEEKPIQLAVLDLNQIIMEILPGLIAEAGKANCRTEVEFAANPLILADPAEMRQLIGNLAKNGLEAMPNGGMLSLKTRSNKGRAVLVVKDEGQGIPQEITGRLGTPFFSTKDGGRGLGLAVCQGIAARHGANITFQTGHKGTAFSVYFPLQKVRENKNSFYKNNTGQSGRIFVLDR